MRARKSSNFCLIGPPTAELAALERLKKIPIGVLWEKRCLLFFSAVLDRILFMLAGNDNTHESLDGYESNRKAMNRNWNWKFTQI